MHKVRNFGSALQAFALQKAIKELGYESQLIDYIFPKPVRASRIRRLFLWLSDMATGFSAKKKKKRFELFYKDYFYLSPNKYDSGSIKLNPPIYDVFMVGSDQVWNPNFIEGETDFLLGFVPDDKPKLAFASSFAVNTVPENLQPIYSKFLKRFDAIAVREKYGVDLVKQLAGKESVHVCDPVILLDRHQWLSISNIHSIKHIGKPYILVYMVAYMFNPFPEVDSIVDEVQNKLGLRVIYLEGSKRDLFKPNSLINKDSGPLEFISLFANASFVITSSFHGAAFSSIFGKPFLGIVKDKESKGDRIVSLLKILNCENSLVNYNQSFSFDKERLEDYTCQEDKLDEYRNSSYHILKTMLYNIHNG